MFLTCDCCLPPLLPTLFRFYGIVSLAIIVLYFVTSSDSGSLVIDCLTANGNPHPPLPQRVFWALTEGAAASALLIAGGKEAVTAVQTASILAGLPYTFILCLLCPALWTVLRQVRRSPSPISLISNQICTTVASTCG